MERYDHTKVEKKWQKIWEETRAFAAQDDSAKPKAYVLDMFPYPSGAGLHVGHVEGYTATDIYSRYKRANGFNVLHPMGWDAFGLPAENYAIKTGTPPRKTTDESIANFKKQIKHLGLSYDWEREFGTHNPEYYRWTQWLFIKFFEKGLVYKKKALVNWDPVDQTVLANEQVLPDGTAERSGAKVEKKELEQWFYKITDYAEELIEGLQKVDWPESTKINQRNWIGKSEGAEIRFPIARSSRFAEIVLASNNQGKKKRIEELLEAAGIAVTVKMPADIGIIDFDVIEDGKTLAENAEKKARTLAEKINLPVLAEDSGFFIEGEEIDPVTVKRNALNGEDEKSFTVEEIALKMQSYYANIAHEHGGSVDAVWRNSYCLITPDKEKIAIESVRPVTLTDEPHGVGDPYLPLRPLYKSKVTGKYVLEQSKEEEMKELEPYQFALMKLLSNSVTVFTTRPDTLFGATYMVLAPEHMLVQKFAEQSSNKKEIADYVAQAKNKSDMDRSAEGKEKTGVELKGVKAINPPLKKKSLFLSPTMCWPPTAPVPSWLFLRTMSGTSSLQRNLICPSFKQ